MHPHLVRSSRSLILRDDPPRMYDTRQPAENRKTDVDEEVCSAASLQEDGKRWEEDGKEVEADIGL